MGLTEDSRLCDSLDEYPHPLFAMRLNVDAPNQKTWCRPDVIANELYTRDL